MTCCGLCIVFGAGRIVVSRPSAETSQDERCTPSEKCMRQTNPHSGCVSGEYLGLTILRYFSLNLVVPRFNDSETEGASSASAHQAHTTAVTDLKKAPFHDSRSSKPLLARKQCRKHEPFDRSPQAKQISPPGSTALEHSKTATELCCAVTWAARLSPRHPKAAANQLSSSWSSFSFTALDSLSSATTGLPDQPAFPIAAKHELRCARAGVEIHQAPSNAAQDLRRRLGREHFWPARRQFRGRLSAAQPRWLQLQETVSGCECPFRISSSSSLCVGCFCCTILQNPRTFTNVLILSLIYPHAHSCPPMPA